jgi:hypothetical protein
MKHIIDNKLLDMTDEQIAEHTTAQADAKQSEVSQKNEQDAKDVIKASGNTKLLDLGLTQAEATALTGYTPSED